MKRTEVVITDDITGEPGAALRTFGLDGASYEIDLSEENSERLSSFLAPFVEAARRVGKNGAVRKAPVRKAPVRKAKLASAPAVEPVKPAAEPVSAAPRRGRAPMPAPPDKELLDLFDRAGTYSRTATLLEVSLATATKWVKAAQARAHTR